MKIPAQSQQSGWGLPLPETFMLGSLPSPVLLPFAPWPIFPENVSLVNHMNPTRLPGFASRAPDTGPRALAAPPVLAQAHHLSRRGVPGAPPQAPVPAPALASSAPPRTPPCYCHTSYLAFLLPPATEAYSPLIRCFQT